MPTDFFHDTKLSLLIYNIYKKFLFSNRNFGNKIMPIKPLVPKLPKLLEDRDKTVREESKTLIIEIYRWIKQAIKPQMTNFNPIQVKKNVYWVLIVLKWFISLKYFIHICTSLLSMIQKWHRMIYLYKILMSLTAELLKNIWSNL